MAEHLDPADLAELSLGTAGEADLEEEARRHLRDCAQCRHELAELQRVVRAARSAGPADLLRAPPGRVWEAIVRDMRAPYEVDTRPSTGAAGPVEEGSLRRAWRRHGPTLLLATGCFLAGAAVGGAVLWWNRHRWNGHATALPRTRSGAAARPAGRCRADADTLRPSSVSARWFAGPGKKTGHEADQ